MTAMICGAIIALLGMARLFNLSGNTLGLGIESAIYASAISLSLVLIGLTIAGIGFAWRIVRVAALCDQAQEGEL